MTGRFFNASNPTTMNTTFFCRAVYSFHGIDASQLSFQSGDTIEVLSQAESGWWDGLLNDRRGWIPSNYVVRIPRQGAAPIA
jgi:son of sevenless-like protein